MKPSYKYLVFLVNFGVGFAVLVHNSAEHRLALHATQEPESISYRELSEHGPGENNHRILTDFKYLDHANWCVRFEASGKADTVVVPLFPSEQRTADQQRFQNVRVVLTLQNVTSVDDLNSRLSNQWPTGMFGSRGKAVHPRSLEEFYPGLDVRDCWSLEVGERPGNPRWLLVWVGLGWLMGSVGLAGMMALLLIEREERNRCQFSAKGLAASHPNLISVVLEFCFLLKLPTWGNRLLLGIACAGCCATGAWLVWPGFVSMQASQVSVGCGYLLLMLSGAFGFLLLYLACFQKVTGADTAIATDQPQLSEQQAAAVMDVVALRERYQLDGDVDWGRFALVSLAAVMMCAAGAWIADRVMMGRGIADGVGVMMSAMLVGMLLRELLNWAHCRHRLLEVALAFACCGVMFLTRYESRWVEKRGWVGLRDVAGFANFLNERVASDFQGFPRHPVNGMTFEIRGWPWFPATLCVAGLVWLPVAMLTRRDLRCFCPACGQYQKRTLVLLNEASLPTIWLAVLRRDADSLTAWQQSVDMTTVQTEGGICLCLEHCGDNPDATQSCSVHCSVKPYDPWFECEQRDGGQFSNQLPNQILLQSDEAQALIQSMNAAQAARESQSRSD